MILIKSKDLQHMKARLIRLRQHARDHISRSDKLVRRNAENSLSGSIHTEVVKGLGEELSDFLYAGNGAHMFGYDTHYVIFASRVKKYLEKNFCNYFTTVSVYATQVTECMPDKDISMTWNTHYDESIGNKVYLSDKFLGVEVYLLLDIVIAPANSDKVLFGRSLESSQDDVETLTAAIQRIERQTASGVFRDIDAEVFMSDKEHETAARLFSKYSNNKDLNICKNEKR